jgi:hypothetical protein
MDCRRIFPNFACAIWLWCIKSNTHNAIPASDTLLRVASIVDQGTVAKPSSTLKITKQLAKHKHIVLWSTGQHEKQFTCAETVRNQFECSNCVTMGIEERRPCMVAITGSQRVVFGLVEKDDILIIYDRHLHDPDATCAYLLVCRSAIPRSSNDGLNRTEIVIRVYQPLVSDFTRLMIPRHKRPDVRGIGKI